MKPFFSCSVRGLSDADIADLNSSLKEQVEENMGMAMIYVLVSASQEWLREKASSCNIPSTSRSHEFSTAMLFCTSGLSDPSIVSIDDNWVCIICPSMAAAREFSCLLVISNAVSPGITGRGGDQH